MTLDELRALREAGADVVLVDARKTPDAWQAAGAVRVRPDDPVRDATALRLAQHATLVVYCA